MRADPSIRLGPDCSSGGRNEKEDAELLKRERTLLCAPYHQQASSSRVKQLQPDDSHHQLDSMLLLHVLHLLKIIAWENPVMSKDIKVSKSSSLSSYRSWNPLERGGAAVSLTGQVHSGRHRLKSDLRVISQPVRRCHFSLKVILKSWRKYHQILSGAGCTHCWSLIKYQVHV